MLGIIFIMMIALIVLNIRDAGILPMLIMPTFIAFGIFVMSRTIMRYKKVAVDDEFLYVSNYRKEIKIPVSKIEDVSQIKWFRTRPVTIYLKEDSEFGREIVFTPKLGGFQVFADNPVVKELKEKANIKTDE
jgi:hypothetical protein